MAVAVAATCAWLLYRKYITDPWTRDSQVRANIVGIAPRVAGPIINIPVHDNQEVKAGDLLFEIDPADYKTALASGKASVANLEANGLPLATDPARSRELGSIYRIGSGLGPICRSNRSAVGSPGCRHDYWRICRGMVSRQL